MVGIVSYRPPIKMDRYQFRYPATVSDIRLNFRYLNRISDSNTIYVYPSDTGYPSFLSTYLKFLILCIRQLNSPRPDRSDCADCRPHPTPPALPIEHPSRDAAGRAPALPQPAVLGRSRRPSCAAPRRAPSLCFGRASSGPRWSPGRAARRPPGIPQRSSPVSPPCRGRGQVASPFLSLSNQGFISLLIWGLGSTDVRTLFAMIH